MVTPDHYNILGLDPTCDDAVIREVYLALMRRYHPDRNPSGAAAVRARAITAAYAVLGNPEERSNYDGTRVPILMISEPPNSQSPRRTSTSTAWFTAAAGLGRRAITAADSRAKALRDRTQTALAPVRLRSAKAVASGQRRRLKLTLANLVSSAGAFQDNVVTTAGTLLAGWHKRIKRDVAGNQVGLTPDAPQDKSKDASKLRSEAPLKPMKDSQTQDLFRERPPALFTILSDESDRGAVVLFGGLAEGLLADRIIEALPEGEKHRDDLLRPGGILSSLPAKVTMGQALGIISAETAQSLNILGIMCDICARSKVNINLCTRELRDVFCLLLWDDAVKLMRTATNKEFPRLLFNSVVTYHFELLLGASPEKAQQVFDEMLRDTFDGVEAD